MDDFGGKLRQARERRGISLRQIAASTKISAGALEALERNDISKLPGGIFSRAFVRSYALEVGLDPDDTVREFLERFNQEPAPAAAAMAALPEEEREFQERQRKALRIAAAAIAALVVLIVVLVFAYRARVASRAGVPADATEASAPVTPQASPPLADAAPTRTVPDVVLPAPPPAPVTAPATPPPVRPVALEIAPTADCWVSVTVDGKKVLARVVVAGEKQAYTVTKDATVEIGDAGSFAYSINGKPGKPLGDKGQVKTLKVTAAQYSR